MLKQKIRKIARERSSRMKYRKDVIREAKTLKLNAKSYGRFQALCEANMVWPSAVIEQFIEDLLAETQG